MRTPLGSTVAGAGDGTFTIDAGGQQTTMGQEMTADHDSPAW